VWHLLQTKPLENWLEIQRIMMILIMMILNQ